MAVTAVYEKWQGRGGNVTFQGDAQITRVFQVITDSPTDNQATVLGHPAIPRLGSSDPISQFLFCTDLDVQNSEEDARVWIVTATFEILRTDTPDPNPLNDVPEISWSTEQFQEPAVFHTFGTGFQSSGQLILNSAGDFFDPPPQKDDSRIIATVRRNIGAGSAPLYVLDYVDAVNSDPFVIDGLSIGIRVAKVQRVSLGTIQVRNDFFFRPLEIVMQFKPDTWDLRILDAGYHDINGKKLTNSDGTFPSTPLLLDGSGLKLANPSPTTAVFGQFPVYRELPFSQLPLV